MATLYVKWRRHTPPPTFREGTGTPPEQLLQAIWQHQRLRRRDLPTTDGRLKAILRPGFLNLEAGPDFRRALVQVGNAKPLECDVEVDVRSAGWRQHGHDTNPAFGTVGLHVVWQAGPYGPSGLPVVELQNQLDAPLGQLTDALGQATTLPPQNVRGRCAAPLRDLPAEGVADLLGQAAQVRLETKAAALAAIAERAGWEQALWDGLFTALGYKQNSWPMRRLAELLPELRRGLGQTPEPVVLLARLLGTGGLLPDQLDRDKLTNRYLRTLWDQWWRDRDRLARRILPSSAWTFHGLRPANRPERRLALAAHWLAKRDFVTWLDDWICQLPKKPSPAASLLGHLAVNVLLPWLHARATAADNDGLDARVAERYFAWPKAQDNSRLKFVRQRLFGGRRVPLRGAALQQGLLQVQADFCNRTNALCEDCAFPDLVRRYSLLKT